MSTFPPQSPGIVPRAERLVGVDLLRAVAIVHVIAVHLNLYIRVTTVVPAVILSHWDDGVTVFFVVSGFLITRTIMQREDDIYRLSLRAFYARRIARIQPLLLASIGFGVAMLALGFAGEPFKAMPHAAFDPAFWLSLVTFSFNWLRVVAVQRGLGAWGLHWDVMWSLAVEEQFYLLLPAALLLAGSRGRFLRLIGVVIGFCVLARLIGAQYFRLWEFSSFAGFDALGVGAVVALSARRFNRSLAFAFMLAGLVILAFGAAAPDYALRPLLIIVGAAAFIFGVQAQDRVFTRPWRWPARIGELSYELYLLHPLVLAMLAPLYRLAGLGFGSALVLTVAVAVVVASGVERGFTRPANLWLRRYLLRAPRPIESVEA